MRRLNNPDSALSFGRRAPEKQDAALAPVSPPLRGEVTADQSAESVFLRDLELLTRSNHFRRLAGQSMLAPSASPAFQNRATHSVGVALMGERIAQKLGLDNASRTLVRAIAIAHDMGHPPFSHEGEEAINAKLAPYGLSWDHDAAALDMVLQDESQAAEYDGLPLSTAFVEGLAKRYWRYSDAPPEGDDFTRPYDTLPSAFKKLMEKHDFHLNQWNHVEGQIAATADWLEETVSDFYDAMQMYATPAPLDPNVRGTQRLAAEREAQSEARLKAKGFLDDFITHFPPAATLSERFSQEIEQLFVAPADAAQSSVKMHRQFDAFVNHFSSDLRELLLDDLLRNVQTEMQRHAQSGTEVSAENIRSLDAMLITPSATMQQQLNQLKSFYKDTVYPQITDEYIDTSKAVGLVFDDLVKGTVPLTNGWAEAYALITQNSHFTPHERAKATHMLVARYMSETMSDRDVLWHLKEHQPELYATLQAESSPSPHPIAPYKRDMQPLQSPQHPTEKTLTDLQNGHHLAIHMWEEVGRTFTFPQKLWKVIGRDHEAVQQGMEKGNPLLLSMSLLPAARDGGAMLPYNVDMANYPPTAGYAVDVSQDGEQRAYIPRMRERTVCSEGALGRNKKFNLKRSSAVPEITEVMDGKNRKELIAHSMTAQGARDTEKQLEALQNYMRSKLDAEPEEIHMYNELLVANSGEQVKAIIIPIYRDKNGIDADATLPQEDTIATLCGAVAGLEHLAHGVDLPVALYHVKEPEPGKIGYVGQGRKELRAVALKAIGELQGPDPEKLEEHLNDACGITLTPHEEEDYYMRLRRTNMRKFLHNLKTTPGLEIDPFTPIDEQRTQTDKLTTQERTTPDKAGRQ